MLSGRGCPFKCAFCQPAENAVFGKPFRQRSVDNVLAEMRYLYYKYKYKSASFWDDTFTVNRHWVNEFCDKYDIPVPLSVTCRADIICNNEAMIERLAKIGVTYLVIGFESGSQRILDMLKKGTTVEQNIKAAEICRKYGIKVFASFMLGLPTETKEESLMTEKMMETIDADWPCCYWYTPIPGTKLYKYCEDNDLMLHDMDMETIARTAKFVPQIKGIDYTFLHEIMERHGYYAYGGGIRKRIQATG
jgi:anaerobic magnesium-protoporphyrin IX monomethyl ester cyclase